MTRTRTLPKEHQTSTCTWLQARRRGGGDIKRGLYFFPLVFRDWGTIRDRAFYRVSAVAAIFFFWTRPLRIANMCGSEVLYDWQLAIQAALISGHACTKLNTRVS